MTTQPTAAAGSVTGEHPRTALFAKGFRPFFLAAGIFAAVILPLWLFVFTGVVHAGSYLAPAYWHAHEMVFGYAVAVIAGFLLTAVANWTKRETVVGGGLLGLAALWLAGRVVMSAPSAFPRELVALVDGAFLPVLGVVLARPIIASRDRRNYVMIGVVSVLTAANVAVHLDALGVLVGWQRRGALLGTDVILLLIIVVAGRVVPLFTRNTTKVATIRSVRALDLLAIVTMALVVGFDVFAPASALAPMAVAVAALFAAIRIVHWGTRHSLRDPMLWSLHVGYAWLPIGLALRALSSYTTAVPASLATHALTVGAIGTLTVSMMARVAIGHTGRPIHASKLATFAFVAITMAAGSRVLLPLVLPSVYLGSLIAAGVLWALAFVAFVAAVARILVTPRPDGKPG